MQRATSNTRVNHQRLNAQQIKEQEALNRERTRQDDFNKERKQRIVQQQRDKYSHVQPTVSKSGPVQPPAPKPSAPCDDVEIKVFVRECEGENSHMFAMMESAAQQSSPAPPLQRGQQQVRGQSGTRQPAAKGRSAAVGGPVVSTAGRGEVPEYLKQRKAEAAAERAAIERQRQEDAERSKWPPGHRPMEEEERLELLARLDKRKKELEYDLVRIPVRIDTIAVQKRRQQIEAEIDEVDNAVAKFSVKKQLFVPL